MSAFAEIDRKRFEDWMIGHIRRFFSSLIDGSREEELRQLIRHGVERAAHHGIVSQRAVCKYIDLLVVFGKHLDLDPRYPWAAAILARPDEGDRKVQALQAAAMTHQPAELAC